MNILLTSAGRRSYLVEYFREALAGEGQVICANSDPFAPAMRCADVAVPVLRSDHPDYPHQVLDLCQQHQVGLVTSLHDLDLFVLSQYKKNFLATDCRPVFPEPEIARMALDKHEMNQTLGACGLAVPWSSLHVEEALEALEAGLIRWPLIVKHRSGFGSEGLFHCADQADLLYAVSRTNRENRLVDSFYRPKVEPAQAALIQERVVGQEFCLGLVSDFSGTLQGVTRAEIHAMRSGESDSATTCTIDEVQELGTTLSGLLRVPGFCGVDYLEHEGRQLIIDINPRFTGDYPFAHQAGLNVPRVLIAWAHGEIPNPEWLLSEPGVRGYKDIVLRPW